MFSPEQKKKRAEASARWRAANPAKYLAGIRGHRARNRDTTKAYDVARMKSFKLDRVLQEIAKCELVCANCHRIRTADRRK